MLTPDQLYYSYTTNPCTAGGNSLVVGAGTPYDLPKLTNFLKQLAYPCYSGAKYSQTEFVPNQPEAAVSNGSTLSEELKGILNSGKYRLALPYKILSRIDVEAFNEVQPDIKSGTSMAIRNACDIARACKIEASKNYLSWEHRMGYEYLYYFGDNNIADCLMMLGPDLVSVSGAFLRGTSCGALGCLPSGLGTTFSCVFDANNPNKTICSSCKSCNPDQPVAPTVPNCCSAGSCEEKMRLCCNDVTGDRDRWRLTNLSAGSVGFGYPTLNVTDFPLKHGGVLKRKSYDGYINLLNNSGPNLYACPPDLLLRYIQNHNNYDYINNVTPTNNASTTPIDRIRTISLIYSANQDAILGWIKDLVYNGYGVVIMTNVGFPNKRDSTGLSYPDRIWYHSYAIIGYDDRRVDYNECVFLLANSWGKWNSGGHPKWGPIPDGSFLVTESHLKCMLDLYRTDQAGCRKRTQPANNYENAKLFEGCVTDSSCVPWNCGTRQKALGMAFALSFENGFPRQVLDYSQFYRTSHNPDPISTDYTFNP